MAKKKVVKKKAPTQTIEELEEEETEEEQEELEEELNDEKEDKELPEDSAQVQMLRNQISIQQEQEQLRNPAIFRYNLLLSLKEINQSLRDQNETQKMIGKVLVRIGKNQIDQMELQQQESDEDEEEVEEV